MAPKKKKPTRYDAAYDHLGPTGIGFTKRAIRKKIDNLLKVYGEADGWVFIEEGAYKLLIECLLEDPEPEPVLLLKGPGDDEQEEEEDLGHNQQVPMIEDSTIIEKRITRSASAAKKSNAIDIYYEPTDSEPMTEEVKKRLEKKRSVASFLFGRGDSVPLLPAAVKDKSQRELTGLDDGKFVSAQEKKLQKKRSQRKIVRLSAFGNGDGKLVSAPEEELQEKFTGPVQDATQYRMRRPCFGLLVSGDDDDEKYVYSETKLSLRERMIRERSVISHGVQRTWWNVVGAI